jgi:hypothetical protein
MIDSEETFNIEEKTSLAPFLNWHAKLYTISSCLYCKT